MSISEFLSRLVRSNAQEQNVQLPNPLQELDSSLQSNQALQASVLVGRKVLVTSNSLNLEPAGDVKIAIDVPEGAEYINASIYTQNGKLIRTFALEQLTPGFYQFSWDGINQNKERAAAGVYSVKVLGVIAGKEQFFKTMTAANVDSVSLSRGSEGLKVNLSGVGSVPFDQIKQIMV